MRHLFLLLLAANVGLFFWGYQREQTVEHMKSRVRADVGDLRLLSEQEKALELKVKQAPEAASASGAKVDELMEVESDSIEEQPEQVEIEIPAEIEVEQQTLPREREYENPETAHKTEGELSQSDEQTTQTEVSKTPGASLDETVLAEEGHVAEQAKELQSEGSADSDQVTEAEQKAQPEPVQFACYRLGPILDLASAEGLSGHLMQLGFDAVMHKKSIKKAKGHWVMILPQASYKEANQKLQELKKAGIADLWLFPRGEYKNAISLGLYSRIANAEVARERALKNGITTAVRPRHIKVEQYWLEFQSAEQPPVTEESRMALQEEYPDEIFAIQPCSPVVTE